MPDLGSGAHLGKNNDGFVSDGHSRRTLLSSHPANRMSSGIGDSKWRAESWKNSGCKQTWAEAGSSSAPSLKLMSSLQQAATMSQLVGCWTTILRTAAKRTRLTTRRTQT